MASNQSITEQIASAIIKMENANSKYNNPGNIMDLPYYQQTGKFRIRQYDSYAEGYQALINQINLDISRGFNFYEFFNKYAPASHGNDPVNYAQFVAGQLGVDPNITISSLATSTNNQFSLPSFDPILDFNFANLSIPNINFDADTLMDTLQGYVPNVDIANTAGNVKVWLVGGGLGLLAFLTLKK